MIPEQIEIKVINLISGSIASKYQIIPFALEGEVLKVLSPHSVYVAQDELEFLTGKQISVEPVDYEIFKRLLVKHFPQEFSEKHEVEQHDLEDESEIIQFVNRVIREAVGIGASDIHFEKYESYARVRFRWEGQLVEKHDIGIDQYNAVVSRIKIMSELNIAEKRLPQDGRINIQQQGRQIDVRVSIIPGKYGEKVVMRLLNRSQGLMQLHELGMQQDEIRRFKTAMSYSNGIILITGPTGSGKTTTLYAALNILNQPNVNITTIEDPIEYNIEGINQVQVREHIGLDFGTALRAYLRQDPDIIMVGEIRDRETASIAIRAALTGHLVFSTVHTNSAWDAISRLTDMGIEPFLLASSLRLAAAQRLIRVLCPHCKRESKVPQDQDIRETQNFNIIFEATGCDQCHFTGYRGRKAIYEIIPISRLLSDKIRKMDYDIENILQQEGIWSLKDHVEKMIREGETSLDEGLMYLIG